jgi:hypothetical protein
MVQALAMDKTYNSMQPLVHRDCHQLPRPHMGASCSFTNYRLSIRYFGPYTVIKCINPIAYEVELPKESKIHPIMHVSQLCKVLKLGMKTSTSLHVIIDAVPTPLQMLAQRW